MKRSPELAPLSRDHHVALDHALRLRRATASDLETTVAVFLAFLLGDGGRHFAREESVLLAALPAGAADAGERLVAEHARIRRDAEALGEKPSVPAARALGDLLAAHVRFEERELFPMLERHVPPDVLASIGSRLAAF
jgi:hypothetical protein